MKVILELDSLEFCKAIEDGAMLALGKSVAEVPDDELLVANSTVDNQSPCAPGSFGA